MFYFIFRGCFQKFELIPHYHQQGRSSDILTSDRLIDILKKIVLDYLHYVLK